MTKKLGEALKQIRLQAGLTQQQMCEGVCSVSAYSKIERGVHKIDIDTLAEILDNTRGLVDGRELFAMMLAENPSQKESKLLGQISEATLLKDKDKLQKIRQKAIAEHTLTELTKEAISCGEEVCDGAASIKNYPRLAERVQNLKRTENWEGLIIFELKEMLPFLDNKEAKKFIEKVYHSLKKRPDKLLAMDFVYEFVILLVNYLQILLDDNATKKEFDLPLKIIFEVTSPLYSDGLFGYGMFAQKVKAIITHDKNLYRDIIIVEKLIGMSPEEKSERLEDNEYFIKRIAK